MQGFKSIFHPPGFISINSFFYASFNQDIYIYNYQQEKFYNYFTCNFSFMQIWQIFHVQVDDGKVQNFQSPELLKLQS